MWVDISIHFLTEVCVKREEIVFVNEVGQGSSVASYSRGVALPTRVP